MNMQRWLKRFSFVSMIGMFLILLMGALVTKTESGRGCGDDWPLCNGKFIPAYTIESLIEYSHRFIVGVVGLILLATSSLVYLFGKRNDAKWYVTGAMTFTFLQAVLGALAVAWPQSAPVLALHFGFSLFSFAFTLLLYLAFTKYGQAMDRNNETRLTKNVRRSVWLVLLYTYFVIYLGAFVRHTQSLGGCTGWPLCNGQVFPELTGATGIAFTHRVASVLLGILIFVLFLSIRTQAQPGSNLYRAARFSFVFVILQIVSGGFVTLSMGHEIYLLASLLHTVLISCLFGMQCYLCITTMQASEEKNVLAYAASRNS